MMKWWLMYVALTVWTVINIGMSYILLLRIRAWDLKYHLLDEESDLYRHQLKLEVDQLVRDFVRDPHNPKWHSLIQHPRLH